MMRSDILDAREERVILQEELQEIHQRPLLVHRVNTPGKEKNNALSRGIFETVELALKKAFGDRVLAETMLLSAEGPVMIRVMAESAAVLKAQAMAVEEDHPLGRFVDLDVYDLGGASISRTVAGQEPRRCYLCGNLAHSCVRSQKHSTEKLLAFMEKGYLNSINR